MWLKHDISQRESTVQSLPADQMLSKAAGVFVTFNSETRSDGSSTHFTGDSPYFGPSL